MLSQPCCCWLVRFKVRKVQELHQREYCILRIVWHAYHKGTSTDYPGKAPVAIAALRHWGANNPHLHPLHKAAVLYSPPSLWISSNSHSFNPATSDIEAANLQQFHTLRSWLLQEVSHILFNITSFIVLYEYVLSYYKLLSWELQIRLSTYIIHLVKSGLLYYCVVCSTTIQLQGMAFLKSNFIQLIVESQKCIRFKKPALLLLWYQGEILPYLFVLIQ